MDRDTILIPGDYELTRLPLDAVEAFVLLQIDGRLTLEEIGEIAGLDFERTARLATRLVELDVVSPSTARRSDSKKLDKAPPRQATRPDPRAESASIRPGRVDPRVEKPSIRPGRGARPSMRPSPARAEKVSTRVDPRAEKPSMRPAARAEKPSIRPSAQAAKPSMRPEPRKDPRRATKSVRAPRLEEDACDLDEETLARITSLDTKLKTLDHYALLGIERAAEKRDVKRAYFMLAATFHPDRFFRKKLGRARAPLDRIFIRLTEAHDVLSSRARRAEYDATLPIAPSPPMRPSRRLSKAPGRPSKTLKAMTARPTPAPAKIKTKTVPPGGSGNTVRDWPPRAVIAPTPAPPPESPPESETKPCASVSEDRFRRAHAAATQIKALAHVDVFVQAAEEALRVEDVVGAANNYRLALQNTDDPFIRAKFEMVEELAKTARSDKSLARARAAERDTRWADAALHFAKAHEARPDAAIADRAAHALRMSGGDLHRAAGLAEQAVKLDSKNASYRVTLGEIYLTANLVTRAKAESARALELSPRDARALELAAALGRKE